MLTEAPPVSPELPRRSKRIWIPSFIAWRNLLVGLVLISPLLIRAWCLSKVPDIGEPFDIDQFCRVDIPAGQDAFEHYHEACRLHTAVVSAHNANSTPFPHENYDEVMSNGWGVASEPLKVWLADYREALIEWRRGTECPDALYRSPREGDVISDYTFRLPIMGSLRDFARLAKFEAMQSEAAGDSAEAMNWYVAMMRCGCHLSRHADGLPRMVGSALHPMSAASLVLWAEEPGVTADQLRLALNEVRAAYRMTAPLSTTLKADYVLASNTFKRPDILQIMGFDICNTENVLLASVAGVFLWVSGEPQATERVLRQILVNQLNEIDKPLPEQQPKAGMGNDLLFQLDPNFPRKQNQLPPAEINRAIARLFSTRIFIPSIVYAEGLKILAARERARQSTLEVALAAQAYQRDHGVFPQDPTTFVPEYLDAWPVDPFDTTDQSIRYRLDSVTSAVVWSVGLDGNDDGGDVNGTNGQSSDVGIVLKNR